MAQINTTNPCLIVFLIDQSGSMMENFGADSNISKSIAVADAVNETIHNIGLKCVETNNGVPIIKDRFEIAVIGYGKDNSVNSAWLGKLTGRWVVGIKEIWENPYEHDAEEGSPIWIKPEEHMATPMTKAFENAKMLCDDWIECLDHAKSEPPIIINITDGEATDAGLFSKKLIKEASAVKNLSTDYGAVSIFNIHITSNQADTILFPANTSHLDNGYADILFNISSNLTANMIKIGRAKGFSLEESAKGFVFNGKSDDLISFLDIGSSPA